VTLALTAVAGAAVAGRMPGGFVQEPRLVGPTAQASAARHGVERAPRADTAVAPAALEGASALADRTFLIPPPSWLMSHRRLVEPSTRLLGLNWQADPYMD
jgi:hypothetical protein